MTGRMAMLKDAQRSKWLVLAFCLLVVLVTLCFTIQSQSLHGTSHSPMSCCITIAAMISLLGLLLADLWGPLLPTAFRRIIQTSVFRPPRILTTSP